MKYELITGSDKGVLIDRTPVMRDVRDTFEVSFILPDNSGYLALFKGADGIEYRKGIKDGICKVPKELLNKEQFIELTVCQVNNDEVLQSWECEPIKVTAFFGMRRNQWQLSGGMTDKDCFKRLVELEKRYAQTAKTVNEHKERITALEGITATQSEQIAVLKGKLNEAITAVNNLSERVEFMEENYNPLNT